MVVLPGGFAHGDYLRPGAIASFSEVMGAVVEFAEAGGAVVGICNGFQVLCESGLLPGALQKNAGLTFLCQPTEVEVASDRSVLTSGVVLRYTHNPNGSVDDIAGIANERGNVVGLMPHPERASSALLGSTDGLVLFGALLASVRATV